ncbi:MAG: helix-turn-helix transcriptional regulator [Desulfobulbaceae bacterium]|nr:helix-turn-helix transcriptional regulator [Desulfobulbaceae bacterium]
MKIALGENEQAVIERMGLGLRAARIKAEQTQDELAARIGVTRWTVAAMENGDPKVSLAAWIKVSGLLESLEGWDSVLRESENPFAKYDRDQAEKNKLLKTRVRK